MQGLWLTLVYEVRLECIKRSQQWCVCGFTFWEVNWGQASPCYKAEVVLIVFNVSFYCCKSAPVYRAVTGFVNSARSSTAQTDPAPDNRLSPFYCSQQELLNRSGAVYDQEQCSCWTKACSAERCLLTWRCFPVLIPEPFFLHRVSTRGATAETCCKLSQRNRNHTYDMQIWLSVQYLKV